MSEQSTGGYDAEGVIWHAYSPRLMKKIIELFPKEIPVVDLGCGMNNYVNCLNYLGYKSVGYDMVDLGSKNFVKADVSKPIIVYRPESTDAMLASLYMKSHIINVLSMETGEHIPAELADGYLDNLTQFGGDVIMSWAVEGQAGVGHINCRNNDWVVVEMFKRGYELDGDRTAELRESVRECHCSWLKNTLMYFKPAR